MTERMKYKVKKDGAYSINVGKLKQIIADIDDDTVICFNKVNHKGKRDIFGNTIIKGYIKQQYQIGNSEEVTKIILTPYPTDVEDLKEDDTEKEDTGE